MSEMRVHEERVRCDGVTLHVARAGHGPALVLLHGFPENSSSWRHQMEPLARAGFEVLAPDLRGYGLSDKPPGRANYRLSHLAADVAALVRHTGQPRAHVAGHDWGGIVAWSFAGLHPGLLDRLVILNAPHLGIYFRKVFRTPQLFRSWYVGLFQLPWLPERLLAAGNFAAIRRAFRATASNQAALSPEHIDACVDALARPGALTAPLNYYRANFGSGATKLGRAARTDAPTLVIWGERDPALGIELLDGLERVAPRVRVHRIAGAGHWVQQEAAEEVTRAMVEFLREPQLRAQSEGGIR